ncbi:MAG: tyrosine--tRNA ligase [Gemmatimonadales bacterium]|nr:MAG: tyrosine--tRNA ligase [Gemmatimonadales bacterium]
MASVPLFDEYRWRGMLHDVTEGAEAAFAEGPQSAYVGFDPTAASLHVGHLLPIMGLVHLQRAGHTPIALVGGGTGLIGDPSGKTQERQLLTREQSAENGEAVRAQLSAFLDFEGVPNPARMVNNLEWLGTMQVLDFLRDVGKHFSVNVMLRRDTVRRRLEEDGDGISYTEFSYLLLQSYDFLRLYQDQGCRFQFGGSDQWGNIVGGTDLIRRVAGGKAWGVTFPLITTTSGVKFGKTEAGAVWLDPARTSPFRFYQFWLRTEDADVGKYLRFFTLMSRAEVEALDAAAAEHPERREAQKALAEDVTRRVHGEAGLARARTASDVLFGGGLEGLGADEIADIFADVPSSGVGAAELDGEGAGILDLLVGAGVTSSRGEARRSVEQGGIYLNNERVTDPARSVTRSDAVEGRFLVLRKGKRSYHLVRVEG